MNADRDVGRGTRALAMHYSSIAPGARTRSPGAGSAARSNAGVVRCEHGEPRDRRGRYTRALAVSVLAFALGGCEWFTDFKRQPSISTWEVVGDSTRPSRGNPPGSVSTAGTAVSGFEVSYAALPATIDSMSALANPVAADARSLANGRMYYAINCAVCHGDRGLGDGTAVRFGMAGINIVSDVTRARTDGYLFGMIRNGRGLMPSYNRIEEPDRWDVVNYLRALQSGNAQVAAGAVAAPGVTGRAVPGASRMGPTRPVPHALRTPAGRDNGIAPRDSATHVDTARAQPDTVTHE